MHSRLSMLKAAALALMVAGCATLHPDDATPTVNVSAIRVLPAQGLAPRFEIDLHIVNPNRGALELRGIAYTLKLEGYKILTGVANDLPVIQGYTEGEVTLTAAVSVLSSIRFLTDLMNSSKDALAYDLEARLDPGGWRRFIYVSEKGTIDLSGAAP
ncbi:MAG TPA: LEA type 2 family protein [Desulfosarcina sp.]|nr:LEA type 2 family protein [Desulfosarcina sp.]